jgi:hypothetical protein
MNWRRLIMVSYAATACTLLVIWLLWPRMRRGDEYVFTGLVLLGMILYMFLYQRRSPKR